MARNKKLIFLSSLFILLVFFGLLYSEWLRYLVHHVEHFLYGLNHRYSIEKILHQKCESTKEECIRSKINLSKNELQKLRQISSVKEHGKKLFHLQDAKVYEDYIPLNRNTLGWNIILAHPLKLELESFYVPFVGSFTYLGFFDQALLKEFKKRYEKKGYDIYISKIAAFSYIGYFEDPFFSTYLKFSQYQLASIILHEMAHLKLYFKDDSTFSEIIASFIESYAAEDYLNRVLLKKIIKANRFRLKKEYTRFNKRIKQAKDELKQAFSKEISNEAKHILKKRIYRKLKQNLSSDSKQNVYLKHSRLLRLKELNNAVLLQVARYSPPKDTGLKLLWEDCQKNFECWFSELRKLENCPVKKRRQIAEKKIRLAEILKMCE